MCANRRAIFFELEKKIAFFDELDRRIVLGTNLAADKFLLGVKALAADAVKAFVVLEINIAARVSAPQHLLHKRFMRGIGRAHEVAVIDREFGVGFAKNQT